MPLMFLLIWTFDFPTLIFYPNQLQYLFKHSKKDEASDLVAHPHSSKSSTKARWVKLGPPLKILIPFISPGCSAFHKSLERISPHKTNRYGEMGSPWRMPLPGTILLQGFPFSMMVAEIVVTHYIIHLMKISGKLKLDRIIWITSIRDDHTLFPYQS
ncbi:hypothetical protein PanWU01x14_328610 [Parasponia andersonii]|uniref:Uncharacterized protein n=1 Tax=Parasponia andersonii TaxID=3476 RepID=A0A2P5AIT1_PARAD|nr:hypothetical protein PanWU01x14_328610 [Parasponia andersonii]